LAVGGEVGDECAGLRGQEAGFTYQRIWSNGSAAAGGPECVPGAPGPFFGTSLSPSTQQTVPAGGTVTYTLQGWSLAAVPDWTLVALPFPMGMTPSVTLSSATMNNDMSATLTVGVPPTATSGSSVVILVYSADAQGNMSMWPSVVSVP
jgi:hypothetical protein